jgi:hypothetical protein
MAQNLNQVPPNLDVWQVGGRTFLVRMNDRISPPIPMVWEVEDQDRYQALGIQKVDRTFGSWDEFYRTGASMWGGSLELRNIAHDPLEAVYGNWDALVRVRPYLDDSQVVTLFMQAAMEGRTVQDFELQGTNWYRTHTDTERQWLLMNAADPATANKLISDNRLRIADMFAQSGVDNASPELAQLVADKITQGTWSEAYAVTQIKLLADPFAGGDLDAELKAFQRGLDTTRSREDVVRGLVNEWLGPAYAKNWSNEHVESWAGRLRNNPDGQQDLVDILRRHRLALFPEYQNENLSYEDIAGPWRGVFANVWGQTPDETDSFFEQVVRMNDRAGAEKLLRSEGLKRNNRTVVEDLMSNLNGAFGGQIRRADPAIV